MEMEKLRNHIERHGALIWKKVTSWRWKRIGLISGASALVLLLGAQLFYPNDRMPLFSQVDGKGLTFEKKSDAITKLDAAYKEYSVAIYMAGDDKPIVSPKLSELAVTVNTTERIESVDYPWYLRIVPTSLFWIGLQGVETPKATFGDAFQGYVEESLMPNCRQAPVNATLKADGAKLVVVSEKDGRTCEKEAVLSSIKQIQPQLNKESEIHVEADLEKAAVGNDEAEAVANKTNATIAQGVPIDVNGSTVTVPVADLVGWLDFTPHDDTVDVTVNSDRSTKWLSETIAPKVTVQPGTSLVTTQDFTETSRVNGANGQALNIGATVASIQKVVVGESKKATVSTVVVPPKEQYTRSYSSSDQGLSALMANYAKDNPGTFGVSMIELDGKKRRADYNGDKEFVTASTYKLLVAYSLLKQIDSGARDWESNATCFNKMITNSDNPCAEAFLNSIGLKTVSEDVKAIGLTRSTFMKSGGPYTTANDLSLLLGMIATRQNFSATNQQRLISAMTANVYRKGIPAGVQGTVADKVGFLNGLLHDAAIVYGPNGTYVLAIMTDGSSWASIADLARKIDELRRS